MKIFPVLFAALFTAASTLSAQEAGSPDPTGRLQLKPAETPIAAPTAPVAPAPLPEVTLIPEQVPPPAPAATPAPEEKKSKTELSAEDMLDRIHFREARIKALRDPKVQAEWERSTKAKTDQQKRDALKSYYAVLYDLIVKLDPTVKKTSELRRQAALHRLEQTRIDPTKPIEETLGGTGFGQGE